MEWLVILGLVGWAWWQSRRVEGLKLRLTTLEERLAVFSGQPAPVAAPAPDQHEEPQDDALLLTQQVPDDELLLDTPIPEASNDDDEQAASEQAPPVAEPQAPAPETVTPPMPEAAAPPPRAARTQERRLEQWLSENGLAWLGGAALALGGILLVAFAAQQSWFTPAVQLGCAVTFAVALIGLSEWSKGKHALVGALLAGAGVATLYACAWAAHALYGMISWPVTVVLLILAAALLVGLSFRHGQPLGVLAVLAALFAPALATPDAWPRPSLTLFLCAIGAAGFTLAALRRWAWAAAVTLCGFYFWFAAAIAADEVRRALALLSFASLGGVALAFRPPLAQEEQGRLTWARTHALGPSIAICISSVAMLWTWLSAAPSDNGMIAAPAWVGALFVALAASAVRARVAPPAVVAVTIASLTLGFAAYLNARDAFGPLSADFYPFILFSAAVTALSASAARPHRSGRTLVAAAGAIGSALLTAFAATSRVNWHAPTAWAPLFFGAAMLFAAAWFAARNAQDPRNDKAVDFWTAAAVALLFLCLESLFPAHVRAAAYASIALGLAAAFVWQGWRALRFGALGAAAFALVHALSPELISAVLTGALPLWRGVLVLLVGAGFFFCAAYLMQRRAARITTGEALSSAGIFFILIAAFLLLRWFTSGPSAPLSLFAEGALRALALLMAGHLTLPRAGHDFGRIGAMRGHILMAAGFIYTALAPGLFTNPWWGVLPSPIQGPPLIGPLALAFAAPAALFLFAAHRLYSHQLNPARLYAGAGALLALTWVLLEIRVVFHGLEAATAALGLLEGACYALLVLAAALGIAIAARRRKPLGGPLGQDLDFIMRGAAWAALAVAACLLLIARHPWWGGQSAAVTGDLITLLAVLAQGAAMACALLIGRALSVTRETEPTRFAAAAAAVLFAWSFGHGFIRWLHQRGAMDDTANLIWLEGYAHALWPLALVLAGAAITARTPGRDTVRAYLYDLRAIWAAAAWPTLAFAALGLWVLYNPWWGIAPAHTAGAASSAAAITMLIIASAVSIFAVRIPHVPRANLFAPATRVTAAIHVLVALTLFTRAVFHNGAIPPSEDAGAIEMWALSAIWALYGAALLALGVRRNDPVLRWSGLVLLLATTVKVLAFDMAQLSGFIKVASVLGLAVVLISTAVFMRRQNAARRT